MLNLFLGKWIETLVPAYMAESIREEVKEELSFLIACLETDHRRKPLMHVSTAAKKKDRTEEKLLSRDGPWQVGPYHKTWLPAYNCLYNLRSDEPVGEGHEQQIFPNVLSTCKVEGRT